MSDMQSNANLVMFYRDELLFIHRMGRCPDSLNGKQRVGLVKYGLLVHEGWKRKPVLTEFAKEVLGL